MQKNESVEGRTPMSSVMRLIIAKSSSCFSQATMFKPILFNCGTTPTPERITHVVRIAVQVFLAAYQKR